MPALPEYAHPFVFGGLVGTAALILAVIFAMLIGDGGDPVEADPVPHTGWEDHLDELADLTAEMPAVVVPVMPGPRRGRHYHDTVELVPQSYRLPANLIDPNFGAFVATCSRSFDG